MSLIPLPKRRSVDLDDSALDEGLGSEELVVRGVVDLGGRWRGGDVRAWCREKETRKRSGVGAETQGKTRKKLGKERKKEKEKEQGK
jgi:hypothetical protein